ncbi:short-chain dehydrogenase [Lewinellaceae bacterium SD302]|nr:short-chain dehydrogenase [Lewinellaceae bacterium SD302]
MNKTVLVTGANAGIGFETAKALAEQGFKVLIHSRTAAKGQAAKARIQELVPGADVAVVTADLGELEQIRALAAKVNELAPSLDVLVNNAGVWNSKLELSKEGVEMTLAVNHLAYFYLSHLLYPNLQRAQNGGRIVCVASDSHKQIKGMFWDDLNLTNQYHGLRSYAQSKLANVLFIYEFARRSPSEDQISAYAVQPGLVQTDIGLKGNTWLHRLAWRVRRQMSGHKTPAEGAATSIYLASNDKVSKATGQYWDDCEPKDSYSSSYEEAEAKLLWEWSCNVLGIKDFFVKSGA